jgi:L-type amino acid transporter 9
MKANVVASEIRNPGQALPKAIKAAMIIVLGSYELVNIAYYILLPWSTVSSSDAVAVVALGSAFGPWAGIIVSILVAISCAGSITSNVFTIGRLTIAASEREYLPAILGRRGLPWQTQSRIQSDDIDSVSQTSGNAEDKLPLIDAPM